MKIERITHISLTLLAVLAFVSPADAVSWKTAAAQISQEINETKKEIRTTQTLLQNEQKELNAELSLLKKEVAERENALEASKQEFETLLETEETLRKEIEDQEKELQSLEEILRTAAKDANEMVSGSLITPENPSRREGLAPLLEPDRFPGMTDIENLVQTLFEEMESGREIRKRTGTFVNAQGAEVSGTILRVGKFTTFYQSGDAVGYLRLDKTSQQMVAIPGKPPWRIRRIIEKHFSGESDHLPLDLTGGIIVEQVNQNGGIDEWLEAGGLLAWPILIIAAIAMILSLERLCSLGRIPTKTDKIMNRVVELASQGKWEEGKELCRKKKKIPACNMLRAGLESLGTTREILENALEEAMLRELPRLERFLTTLSVLAAVAPLLGLLGTVTGMIHTFQGITVFGTSDPRMMSGGISEALVTTQMGLGVAIPVTIIHHFFDRRVEKIIGDMEEKGTALITLMLRTKAEEQN